jgi:molybdenum ABC transporter molybdate-binding protein
MPTRNKSWSGDWSVGVDVRVERKRRTILDERSADLLAALNRTASISASARSLGISYRHAWLLIQEANAAAGRSLIETAVGGRRGGGARLTEYGRAALTAFEQLRASLRTSAGRALSKVLAGSAHDRSVIHLFAAISLQEVVAQLLAEYALVCPTVSVRTVFGASNELADQILSGTSADVFLSANRDQVDRLAAAGAIHKGSRRILARNRLSAVATKRFHGKARSASDLSRITDAQIVVADPACPLGQCTADYLKAAKTYSKLRPKLREVDNSRAVVAALRGGQGDVGLVFSSDITNTPGLTTLFQAPVAQASVSYEGAVLANSASATQAAALLDFLGSKKASVGFRRAGFLRAR